MQQAYRVDLQRTPIARFGKALASVRPQHPADAAIAGLVACHRDLALDATILGCAHRTSASREWWRSSRASRVAAGLVATMSLGQGIAMALEAV